MLAQSEWQTVAVVQVAAGFTVVLKGGNMNLLKKWFGKKNQGATQKQMMEAMKRAMEVFPNMPISIEMVLWHHDIKKEPIELKFKLYIANPHPKFWNFDTIQEMIGFLGPKNIRA